jgi:hypothetical protein
MRYFGMALEATIAAPQAQAEVAGEQMIQMIIGTWVSQTIYVAASLGLADLLKDGEKHLDELATATQVPATRLYRLMRALASVGVFVETQPRTFAQTEKSRLLRADVSDSLRGLSMMLSDEWSWRSWGELLNVIKTGKLPMQYLYNEDNVYDYFKKNPRSNDLFNQAMVSFTRNALIPTLLEYYDFSGITRMMDVGGGHGTLIAAILKAYPQMQGVLFDLPHVVAGSANLLVEEGISDRCTTATGSFFEGVPAGCDAYLVSQILHNFEDEECLTILRHIRKVIPANGKLLVVQGVLPEDNEPHFNKFLDLELMIIDAGGQDRTEPQYAKLFKAAGFELNRIVPPIGAEINLLEALPI